MESSSVEFSEVERLRRREFPVCENQVFFAHAAVTALPRAVARAMADYALESSVQQQEFSRVLADIRATRDLAASLIGARWDEIALLGPTSLGLSLFANGVEWHEGDELVCFGDDYPANVYPWLDLQRRGVCVRRLRAEHPGALTPELVESALNERTRMVALSSCHFFSGYRLDVEAIGALLRARGILFALDAIQTLGAFPLDVVRANVDMLSADAHKWLLGPMAIGIVYVAREHFSTVRPTLLGAWNVHSPQFLAQEEIEFVPTARRYEPGVLNASGVYGMKAALELLLKEGIESISERILSLKALLVKLLVQKGFEVIGPEAGPRSSGITTVRHPVVPASVLFKSLEAARVVASLRHDREGKEYLRFSPHFYNTEEEVGRVLEVLSRLI